MAINIPNTFADKSGQVELAKLDENFSSIKTGLETEVAGFESAVTGTIDDFQTTLNTFPDPVAMSLLFGPDPVVTASEVMTYDDAVKGLTFSAYGFNFRNESGCLYPVGKSVNEYNFTGADQTFVIPAGVTYIFVKMWGAGGGNGRASGWSYGSDAGGGGHSFALIPVTPGESLTIRIGGGGRTAVTASSFGGGGGALNATDTTYGGQGGGGCYIFRSTTPLLIAGGGGGGGASRIWTGNVGGAGGGLIGQRGESPYDNKVAFGGGGGTQLAGGTASGGGSGSLYQGGTSGTNSYGGGGGGGYYGGGGGGYSEANTMAGGGGGSGFVAASCLIGATFTGTGRYPAFLHDNDLPKNVSNYTLVAHGNQNTQNNAAVNTQVGGNAYCKIYY